MTVILDEVNKSSFISKEEISDLFKRDLDEMERRDREVDVKIVDYLREMAEKEILFWSVNHPKNMVFDILSRRLLVFLGYYESVEEVVFKYEKYLNTENTLKIACEAIYPSVNEYVYGERKEVEFNLPGEIRFCEYVEFDEYVENYMNFIWNV